MKASPARHSAPLLSPLGPPDAQRILCQAGHTSLLVSMNPKSQKEALTATASQPGTGHLRAYQMIKRHHLYT